MLRSELLKARNSDVGFATEKRGRARAVDGDVRRQQWWQRAARWVRAHGTHAIPYVRFDHETNGAVILPELFSSEVRSVGLNFNLCIRIVISFFFVESFSIIRALPPLEHFLYISLRPGVECRPQLPLAASAPPSVVDLHSQEPGDVS